MIGLDTNVLIRVLIALKSLLARESLFAFENADVFRKALDAYRRGKAEFSDFLIGAKAAAQRARTTFTFDRVLARQQGFSFLQ